MNGPLAGEYERNLLKYACLHYVTKPCTDEEHPSRPMALTSRLCFQVTIFNVLITIGLFSLYDIYYKNDLGPVYRERDGGVKSGRERDGGVKSGNNETGYAFPKGLQRISKRLTQTEISLNDSGSRAELIYEQ